MVARIKIKDALVTNFYYNENKVEQGVATCLMAENYPADLERLSQSQRLKMLQKMASMNEAIKVNSVHISLNFDPSETLSKERLQEIATGYMEGIGFGAQPYLVYQHFDAGHPHIHILSVKVGMDGKGLDTHNIAIKKSEPVRKELEAKFGLVRAEDMAKRSYKLKAAYAQKIEYGKTESRRAIAAVLEGVLMQYKYSSLAELNAVLRQYNVMADRCRETSRVYKNHGLLYRILDDKGKSVGVPIKASAFYNKPTLAFLEDRFRKNEGLKKPLKGRIQNAIDLYFVRQKRPSLNGMVQALAKQGIHTSMRQNENGQIYGLTFVDHKNKVVFNGSDLGKTYSAKGILERCGGVISIANDNLHAGHGHSTSGNSANESGILDELMQPEQLYEPLPFELKKSRKKRKKRSPNNRL